jgi:hypothetical protein
MLTQQALKELLTYEPDTGLFRYNYMTFYRTEPNKIAGFINALGYVIIAIDGVDYKAHRLAFLYMENKLSLDDVDHINRIRHDNKWKNLREVDRVLNAHNTGHYITNTSGVKGVCFDKKKKLYTAQINFSNKIYKKRFKLLADAVNWLYAKRCEFMPEGHFHVE